MVSRLLLLVSIAVGVAVEGPLAASDGGMLPGWPSPRSRPRGERNVPPDRVRMIFPANAPPLGAWMPRVEHLLPPVTDPARPLCGDMLEPYFAPLSTYLIDRRLTLTPQVATMVAEYRVNRGTLVAELRRLIRETATRPTLERQSAFSALARQQEASLAALEQVAEKIRREASRHISWNQRRRWSLGTGALAEGPREKHCMLEYQVIRAAAFYEAGLLPAQRRLLREAAWHLETGMFNGADSAAALFTFFSPDLLLVQFPAHLPQALMEDIAEHAQRKETLRRQLRDTLYEVDPLKPQHRQPLLKRLARTQQPEIEALEALAERIRQALAEEQPGWRREPPPPLPAQLDSQVHAYLALQHQHQVDYETALAPLRLEPPPRHLLGNASALQDWRQQKQLRMEQATDDFLRDQGDVVADLRSRVKQLEKSLEPYLLSADIGSSARESVLNFLHRRRQESTYHEYGLAAFEPGLSPRQRTLLFAAAVARLELPLPAPEDQPVHAPGTLLK